MNELLEPDAEQIAYKKCVATFAAVTGIGARLYQCSE